MNTLFRTVHGSRLYGLAHEDSDYDYYTVVGKSVPRRSGQTPARYAKQTIVDGEDSVVIDSSTWLDQCRKGVPQALEAMFSDMAVGRDCIASLRKDFRVGTGAFDTYLRTIKSFALTEEESTKRRRHALRLALNFAEMRESGRFNPTLTPGTVQVVNYLSKRPHEEVYEIALDIAWS